MFFAGVGQELSLDKAAGPAGAFNKEFDWHSFAGPWERGGDWDCFVRR